MPSYDTLTSVSAQLEQYAMGTSHAARFIDRSPAALRSWRADGTGPRYSRIGNGAIFYRVTDLREWADTGQNVALPGRPDAPVHDEGYLDVFNAACFIGRKPSTLNNWRSGRASGGPTFIQHRQNAKVYYRVSDLRKWIDSGLVETHSVSASAQRRGPALVAVLPSISLVGGDGHEQE